MTTDGQPRAESPLHLAAPTIPTARPLNASAKALLILSACAMIALCYLFSLAAMTVIVLFLAVELVIFVALLRFGMIGIITPVMERHGGLLTLFARSLWLRKGEHGRVPLNRDEAPRLFSILDSLAGRLGIAVPREVVVEMNVGAWVELRGWRQGSKATRLGIGYDLLAGLTEAEVEAVLAHEMAHARLVRRGLRTWLGGGFARIANLTNQLSARQEDFRRAKKSFAAGAICLACADACTRVDDEHIHRLLEVHQLLEHIASLNLSHVGQSRNTRGAGEQAKSAWRSHHHFIEGAFARDHIFERRSRRDAAQHVSVGKAKICVKQNGAQSAPCEIHREIDREIGLAHTALTAGDRDCAR